MAVGHAAAAGLSVGVFAPGWTFEAGPGATLFVGDTEGGVTEGGVVDEAQAAASLDEAFWLELDTARVRGAP
jgi:hypothetical protein